MPLYSESGPRLHSMPAPSVEQLAARFGCSVAQVRDQCLKNSRGLRSMAVRARIKGGLYRGKTAEEWSADADRYFALSQP